MFAYEASVHEDRDARRAVCVDGWTVAIIEDQRTLGRDQQPSSIAGEPDRSGIARDRFQA